ncbi:MAG TPA: glycosyltransferase family 4 protein [Devosia sp.]|jgi:glycosyltransferase involved in cell wall biosynthesis|uniref:glycosyltransferase family 4 protein n=1 Tax=unclassified Sphingomonas TaxID=196159 RepID=UPI000DBBCD2E|nr:MULTISPECIES: glycosyltransferase family 4 protein [unclassified Sphingomonas]PZT90842.1 MAG: glycosyltransferase WbuB [Sphingomonas sp.]RSV29536.1 glycosyltransferase WbuB [Sphingomonas sp. ABOLH]HEV7291530.1 glycosyltransferase family 4 protein [Devosia sp.]
MNKKVIFVNRFFWPDESATSQILSDVAFNMNVPNTDTIIITSRLSYSDPNERYLDAEDINGVRIVRVWTSAGGKSLAHKALAFASFYVTATIAAWQLLRKGDVLVAKTDPPLLSIPMLLATRLRGARLVTWLQDLYPELAGELGVAVARGMFGNSLRWLRNRSLKAADMNVVIGRRMHDLLVTQGVSPNRTLIIQNWTSDQTLVPNSDGYQALRAQWGFSSSDIVVGYSGNLGRAHDVGTLLDAARILQEKGRSDIRFLFIGGGKLREQLSERAEQLGLTNIVCRPYVERAFLAQSLAVSDIHWLSLRPELEGMIVPSKFYGIAAAGRPAIFIGAENGEIAQLLANHAAGLNCQIGDAARLSGQIEHLAANPALRATLGANGRQAIDTELNQKTALEAWTSLIKQQTA